MASAFDNNNNRILLNYHDAVLYESDLALLQSPTAWLNDACMHFGMTLLNQKLASDSIVCMDSSCISFFMHQCVDEDEIEEFIRGNPELQQASLVLIPINNGHSPSSTWHHHTGTHWSLLAVTRTEDDQNYQYLHFDSVSGSNARTSRAVAEKFCQVLPQSSTSKQVYDCKTPQQLNGFDCGLHVLAAAELLANQESVNETSLQTHRFSDMLELRQKLAAEATRLAKEYSSSS